jgi:hypothetical protein
MNCKQDGISADKKVPFLNGLADEMGEKEHTEEDLMVLHRKYSK